MRIFLLLALCFLGCSSTPDQPLQVFTIQASAAASNWCEPLTKDWTALNTEGAMVGDVILWTGRYLVTFSKNKGAIFDPCANQWREAQANGLPARAIGGFLNYAPLIAGDKIFFFYVGSKGDSLPRSSPSTASVFDIARNEWEQISLQGAPTPREGAVIAWTGREVLIFGGDTNSRKEDGSLELLNSGAAYNPETKTWRTLATKDAPSPRRDAAFIWTGSRLLVWGGVEKQDSLYLCRQGGSCRATQSGAMYDPERDTWEKINELGAPPTQQGQKLLWDGQRAVVWPADEETKLTALFDPEKNAWSPVAAPPAVLGELRYSRAYFASGKLLVHLHDSAVYDIARGSWDVIPMLGERSPNESYFGLPYAYELVANSGQREIYWTTPNSKPSTHFLSLNQFNAEKSRWEKMVFPGDAPPMGSVFVWANDRLLTINQTEEIKTENNQVTQDKVTISGGIIRPSFAP